MPAVMKAIDGMNVAEKVQTMDYLWSSLETSPEEYSPPEWHGRKLARQIPSIRRQNHLLKKDARPHDPPPGGVGVTTQLSPSHP